MKKLRILLFVSILLIFQSTIYGQKSAVDLIVQNGTVVTMNNERRVIENGAIAVAKSEIVAVGTFAEIAQNILQNKRSMRGEKSLFPV
jgi:cell division protein FtsL